MNKYTYMFMWYVVTYTCPNFNDSWTYNREWMSNDITYLDIHVINQMCPKPEANLANLR